jgi:hypothetical protein
MENRALLGALTIAIPVGQGRTARKRAIARRSSPASARWRQRRSRHRAVAVTARSLPSGGKRTIRYTDLGGHYSYHTDRSQYIMSQSLPYLRQEFLKAQSAKRPARIGRDHTSQAFEQSLQSALLKLSK